VCCGDDISRLRAANINIGARNVSYLYGGKGNSLVIVHGGGGGVNAWVNSLELLAEHYTVFAPDLPGFGNSQSIDDSFSIPAYVDFLERFTGALGLEKFCLLGHSLGGGIALRYALDFPEKIERLVLVSSLFLGKEIALWARYLSSPSVFRYLGEAGLTIFKGLSWVAGSLCNSCRLSPPFTRVQIAVGKSIMSLKGQTMVLADQLAGLVMPTLLVWGARDGIVPAKHAYAAAGVIPDCRVHVFENCGHHVHNHKTREFSDLLVSFLD
jgi:4,5:9,10-diseco-3-hydroxy-5,9,17-trioxoandrosta-1(10),2-diene-4-oate hydrolase